AGSDHGFSTDSDWILLSLRRVAVLPRNQFQNSEVKRFGTLARGDFGDDYLPAERADFRRRTQRFVWADRIELGVSHPDLQFVRAGGNVWQAKGAVAVTKGAEGLPGCLEKTVCRRDVGFIGGKVGALGTRCWLVGRFQSELNSHGLPVHQTGGARQEGLSGNWPAGATQNHFGHGPGIDPDRSLMGLEAGARLAR